MAYRSDVSSDRVERQSNHECVVRPLFARSIVSLTHHVNSFEEMVLSEQVALHRWCRRRLSRSDANAQMALRRLRELSREPSSAVTLMTIAPLDVRSVCDIIEVRRSSRRALVCSRSRVAGGVPDDARTLQLARRSRARGAPPVSVCVAVISGDVGVRSAWAAIRSL